LNRNTGRPDGAGSSQLPTFSIIYGLENTRFCWGRFGGAIKLHPTEEGYLEAELAEDYAGLLKLTGEKSKIMVVAGARFCHYFTSPIRVPLIPEDFSFSNITKSFLKIPA
jgi:hypothetical protein